MRKQTTFIVLFLLMVCMTTSGVSANDLGHCEFEYPYSFNNGYSWIKFYDTSSAEPNSEMYGLMDKSGKVHYYLKHVYRISGISDEGISHYDTFVQYGGNCYYVTTDGETGTAFADITGNSIYCGDYMCFIEDVSGFDINQRKYKIYGPDGQLIKELVYDANEAPSLLYEGGGIFAFTYPDQSAEFFFAKSGKLLERQLISFEYIQTPQYNSKSDYLLYYVGEASTGNFIITITDANGNWKDIYIPAEYGSRPRLIDSSDRYLLLSNADEFYYLYDLENDSFKMFNGEYANRLDRSGFRKSSCGNEIIALALEGQDGETYFGLYNINNFDLICEPLKGEGSRIMNDYVIVNVDFEDIAVYSKEGASKATLPECSMVEYSDGVYYCFNGLGSKTYYYNDDWQLMFTSDEIDYSGAKLLN